MNIMQLFNVFFKNNLRFLKLFLFFSFTLLFPSDEDTLCEVMAVLEAYAIAAGNEEERRGEERREEK